MQDRWQQTYRVLARTVWLAAGILVLLRIAGAAVGAILFSLLVLILSVALSAPVNLIERRGVPRWLATTAVFLALGTLVTLLGWLVVPRVVEEGTGLASNMPGLLRRLSERAGESFDRYPLVKQQLLGGESQLSAELLPMLKGFVGRVGGYSLSLLGFLLGVLLLVAAVFYAVASPRPLVRGVLRAFPKPIRNKAARALTVGSQAIVGWVWSNVIVGGVEALAAAVFLSWLGIPGAALWAALTFFSELIPKVGAYLMAIPPVLVALAIDPGKAIWVAAFYVIIQLLAGNLLAPLVQARTMKLHPVSIVLATVLLGSAFGLLGALIATPLTGLIKAFYDQFSGTRGSSETLASARVEAVLQRHKHPRAFMG